MVMQALIWALLLPATPARADVSDSGNLTIGGMGVIQGTMTVQGNSFSVGGTTFSVAGGSVTLGGRLNAAPAGIKWADGSTSTTAPAGGGGAAAGGGLIFIASATVTDATSVSFSSLAADTEYSVVFSLTQNTSASNLFVRFNADSNSVYRTAGYVTVDSSISAAFGSGGAAQAGIVGSSQMNASSHAKGDISFASMPGTSSTVTGDFRVTHFDGNERGTYGGFRYSNSAISSFALHTTAGTFTGNVALYRKDKS